MSLEALREMRRQGARPDVPVLVLVGRRPAHLEDSARLIFVDESTRVADMDLRPLVGLWVAVLLLDPLLDQAERLLSAMEEHKAKPYGLVMADGTVHMGIAEPTPEHELNLFRTWELYAR